MRYLLCLVFVLLALEVQAAERPNVIVILSDDLGWGSVGCYGANPALVQTPHIDRLAREGRRFTDANTTSSVCSPTRYSMLTGRYCWRTSLVSEVLSSYAPLHIETSRMTLASMLKSQGYECAAVGKWHLGYGTAERCDYTRELKPGPLEIGFDYHFGVPANHGDLTGVYVENHWVMGLNKESPSSPSPPYLSLAENKGKPSQKALALNAPKRVDDEVMSTLTQKMVAWLRQQSAEKPFFAYYTPVAVHNPITPSKTQAGKSKGGPFCDFLHDLDDSVGQILQTLDEMKLAENTLILFTSDNGGVNKQNGDTPQNVARAAGLQPVGPFKGGKHDVWEGGFRVPYLIRWPGRVPAGTVCAEPISIVDTLASVAAITGSQLPDVTVGAEDSFDMSAAWLGKEHAAPLRPHLITHGADGNFSLRRTHWKWIEGVPADDVKPAAKKARAAQLQPMLYDLKADLAEQENVAQQRAPLVAEMQTLLERYRNGGYSRELPPANVKPKPAYAALPALTGKILLELPLDTLPEGWRMKGEEWAAKDGALWCQAGEKGAPLSAPLSMKNGVIQLQLRMGQAERFSLRLHTADNKASYRLVISHGAAELAKVETEGKATSLARQSLRYNKEEWHTLRLSFSGERVEAQFAGATLQAQHPILAEPKGQMYLIGFNGSLGVKQLILAAGQ